MLGLAAGGGMVAGEQIMATSAHPGAVVLTAMQSVAYQGDLREIVSGLLSCSRDEPGAGARRGTRWPGQG